ncbi:MAG: FtsX-like permease family protein [Eubacterium sp.]|nr:FtsX-like permease family protein [Eubacterium sp.]
MKNSLFRVIRKKYARLLVSMLLVSSLGCGIMSGMSNGFFSLKLTLNEYISDMGYPDVVISTTTTTKDKADLLRGLDGVEEVNPRLKGNLVLIDREGRYISAEALTYDEQDFSKFYYWEKVDKKGEYPILMEHAFCESNGIHAGDELTARLGEDERLCTVYGVISRPETLSTPSIGRMKASPMDVCYIYVPESILEDEENPEYVKAFAEWETKNREYEEAKEKADSEHEKTLDQITDSEKQLSEKEKEMTEKLSEAEQQKESLLRNREEIRKKQQELAELEKQLQSKKDELADGEKKLLQEKQKLEDSKKELAGKREKLDRTKKELEAQYNELKTKLDEGRRSLDENKKKIDEWKELIRILEDNKDQIEQIVGSINLPKDTYERASALVSDVDRILSNTDYVIRMLKSFDQKIHDVNVDSLLDHMGQYSDTLRKLRDQLSDAVKRAEDPAVGEKFREEIISQSRLFLDTFVKDSKTVKEVVDSAVLYVKDMETKLEEGYKQLEEYSGYLKQIEEGLRTVDAGYGELEKYEKKLSDGKKQIRDGEKTLDSYRSQIRDGEKQIADGRREIEKYLIEIEKAIEAIEQGILDGKTEFENARDLLKEAKAEVQSEWSKILKELSRGEEELANAKDQLDDWQGYENFCNQFLIRVSEGMDPEDVRRRAEEALIDVEIKESYTYQTSELRDKLEGENLSPLEIMTMYIPMVFFGVALIVIFLFMNLLVRRCRREIGILRALGFSKRSIVSQFCTVSLIVSLGAVLIGALMGIIVGRLIGNSFQDFLDLYYMNHQFYWGRILLAAGITVLVGQIATLLSMGYVNHIAPAEAMTRPAPKEAFHASGFMRNSNSFFKYSVFSLMRNKMRFFFTVICLAASSMLMFSAFSFGACKDKLLVSYYEDRVNYDCEAFFSYEPSAEKIGELERFGIASSPESVRYYKKEIRFGDASEEAFIQAIPKDTDKVRILDSDEKDLRLSEEGLILERYIAEKLNLKAGEVVTIDGESFPVTAISEQYEGRVQFISLEAAERLGEPVFYSVLLSVEPDQQIKLGQKLSEVDGYILASFIDQNYNYWKKNFRGFTACVIAVILFSVLIGFVIITNTLLANLLEQKKDLCILRTLGFQCSELSFRLFFQTALYYVFACLIGIPAGALVAKMAIDHMETEGRSYPFVNEPYLYLQTAALVLGYLIIGHIISMKSLRKWDIVESVKDKE